MTNTPAELLFADRLLSVCVCVQCTVSVSDNGYPTPNLAQATLLVGVSRDTSVPIFTDNARYSGTVPENVVVASSILTVQATRSNLVVSNRQQLAPPDQQLTHHLTNS